MPIGLIRANRGFRLLLSASGLSNLGDGVAMVAFPWLATLLTRDPLAIAAVATAQRLPWLLFSLPVGVWTDRADRRALILRADLARALLMLLTLALALSTPNAAGGAPILALLLGSFLFGTAEVVRDNAAQAVLPSLVAKHDLERANGQLMGIEQLAGQLLGPPLAGVLIGASVALPFGLDVGLYATAAALVWLIALPLRAAGPVVRFGPALREGLGWLVGQPDLLRLGVMLGAVNAVFAGGMAVLVLYAQQVLGLSAAGYGLLLAFAAAGGVAGGLLAPPIAARLGLCHSLIAALAGFVASNLLLALAPSPGTAALALAIEAAAAMLWNVVTVSYRQRLIPDRLLGRVNAAYRFLGWGAMPLGAMGSGGLVTLLTPRAGAMAALQAPYLVAAVVSALLALYAALRLRGT